MKRFFRRWQRTCLVVATSLVMGFLFTMCALLIYLDVSPLWGAVAAMVFLIWTCIAQDTAEAKRAAENEQEGNGSK